MKKAFLDKAKENLKIAQASFELECYNACANRAYYAAFQAAIAALAHQGAQKGKNDHAWVQSEFNRRVVRRQKIYPAKLKTWLLKMQQVRNTADYSDESVGKKAARQQLSRATEMVRIIEKELNE
ncbi:HEPN domain-containing protein [Desulfonema magnum]|uniref:HEPN domain-containing protein n=2 Tax=Desulfonema magnum TaxID=45655 RepID=A0A975BHG2_9BACT|nr:HEPN domain-containing protein [Desulfonema magnum]